MHTLTRATMIGIAATALGAVPVSQAIAGPTAVHITSALKVAQTTQDTCHAGVCHVLNHGTGQLTPYGQVTFTTAVTAETNQPPCGKNTQWVPRIIRTITTGKGILVLHEAGLLCPKPGAGVAVSAVWAVDGADSTGIFAGASGHGTDTAYPLKNTAAPTGTITLAK